MVIAVDYRGTKEYQQFIYETFKIITENHTQHTFVFISDKPVDLPFTFSENITVVAIRAKISLWSQLKISSVLKKYKADILVTAQRLKTTVPLCLIAFDKTKTASLNFAKAVVAPSEFSKKEIIKKYRTEESKIGVVYKGIDDIFIPLTFDEKEKVKEKYANGQEYFLCVVKDGAGNLLNLLKAFSVFKKMQKSNMQLLMLFDAPMDTEFSEALRLYKFKSDVKVLENITSQQLAKITAGSYAFVYLFNNEDHIPLLQAMKCDVPVITNADEEIKEVCNDAALYFDSNDHKNIADKMMLVYKDENLRQQLIETAKNQVKKYSWKNSADLLLKSIEKVYR